PRIGVFVCHCGLNIAGVIDVEALVEYAKTLPGVVYAVDYRYMCADPGQKLIKDAIKEHELNRVIVAACSPRLHEPTFRRCVAEAGLNPYLFEMANIREHSSWCHPHEPEKATEKAKDLIRMAVARARLLEPLKTIKVPVTKRALVIGGGIAGINAALDLAELGFEVYLVEREPSIGGHMAQLDKTFPTLDCAACILTPKMVDVARHPNIKLLTYSEVEAVEGYIGNYRVKVLKKPRYVDETKCTGCGTCMEKCPMKKIPDEFNVGLSYRTAIYIPFPQAVPKVAVIDPEHCLYLTRGRCRLCEKVCQAGAIDFSQKPELLELDVGVIIVATGFDIYLPKDMPELGYGRYPDVIVGLELERFLNAAGPTGGRVVRPSDKKEPRRVVFIQCVGSRGTGPFVYCSGFCCMYSIKQAVLLKERIPGVDVTILYTDMRTNFKGYEEFYRRARELGVRFVRVDLSGRRVEEDPETGELVVHAITEEGKPVEVRADLVVLATTAIPRKDAVELARKLNIPLGPNGFFMEAHPKLRPVDTAMDGIFLAGACQGLKDIPYSVAQGGAAAARAATILFKDEVESEAITAVVDVEKCIGCGLCADICPFGAPIVEDRKASIREVMCKGCGTCAASCPRGAITMRHFTDEQIRAQLEALLMAR
ncbi:MAG TPA: CoB--CoM heterodisulfide reductase iron-sulfur subunit A family protein, partial [Candidatus Bathyarchaeota archaeon]|nr:CoB--CoM heterodisulfide reductase iron-sulfur subunit A family protein [Candidatus Bathyarchaeota archaeon]